jgi:hypothetical protein
MRRHKVPAPQPVTFECTCGEITRSPDRNLPVGWSTALGKSWCNDCTTAGIPARELAASKRKAA